MRVIVTRPEGDARRWVGSLQAHGLEALALPLLAIAPVGDVQALRQAWQQIAGYSAVMFVSGNAVTHFFACKPQAFSVFTVGAAIATRAWAVGPGTVRALCAHGVAPACIDAPGAHAPQFDSQALWQVVAESLQPGQKVLIVRGDGGQPAEPAEPDASASASATAPATAPAAAPAPAPAAAAGRDWLAQQLARVGVLVEFVEAYQRGPVPLDAAQRRLARAAARDGSVWLFSSAQAVRNLAQCMAGTDWSGARAVATHERIAQAARNAGFGVVCESRPSVEEIVASIESLA